MCIRDRAEASEFKFGMQLGFAKAHHKITPRGKIGCGPWLRELPNILGSPFNISATAEASDFTFSMQLKFAKAHHKITPREKKWPWPWAGELPDILGSPVIFMQRLGLGTSNLARSWGLPRPTIKSHP